MVSVFRHEEVNYDRLLQMQHFTLNFYCVAIKKNFDGKLKYGPHYYDGNAVGPITICPTSTVAGCSIAKPTVQATARTNVQEKFKTIKSGLSAGTEARYRDAVEVLTFLPRFGNRLWCTLFCFASNFLEVNFGKKLLHCCWLSA